MNGPEAAEAIFRAGVRAVRPRRLLGGSVRVSGRTLSICGDEYPLGDAGRLYVTGAGKASAAMAGVLEELLGEHIAEGVIAVKYGHELPLKKIRQIAASHPVPDEKSLEASSAILSLAEKAGPEDLVICLFSGGASSLMADCPPGISLGDLRSTFDLLLRSGAEIGEMNIVRKHLSAVKGGQLARTARPARLVSLIISDVIGDDPGTIASGSTAPDASTFGEALEIMEKYGLVLRAPAPVIAHLLRGLGGGIPETPKAGDPLFEGVRNHVIGNNGLALAAAARQAEALGYHAQVLTAAAEGPAEDLARRLVESALEYTGAAPACLLMGGESTVRVSGEGKGGRNQHLALAAALLLEGRPDITVLSAGTDGTDGPTDMAGAVTGFATLETARRKGLRPEAFLEACDSYHFFEKTGGHIRTGPTQTNVMDLMLVLVH